MIENGISKWVRRLVRVASGGILLSFLVLDYGLGVLAKSPGIEIYLFLASLVFVADDRIYSRWLKAKGEEHKDE